MKILSLIIKSLKEQIRSYWVLLLTLSMGPFFIFVYYLIIESSEPHYSIIVINNDKEVTVDGHSLNHGKLLTSFFAESNIDSGAFPLSVEEMSNQKQAIDKLKNKKADALIIIHNTFTQSVTKQKADTGAIQTDIEFVGDLTSTNYLISAVWVNEIINEYVNQATQSKRLINVKETALGTSASASNFDLIVPGILILSLIMLMFTASIAFVTEVENKTIIRLKLSKLTIFEFLSGISFVQLLVGIFSLILTLVTAIYLGFNYTGSLSILIFVSGLTSISIIAFSLIIAAITKSANEVLVVGNFPMFLFMFFTGAAFPLKSDAWFTIAGYPVNLQGLMTPTHAISALNKTLIMNMNITSILPEIVAIIVLTVLYFTIGAVIFKKRHLKLT